jgi:hypothetical protein
MGSGEFREGRKYAGLRLVDERGKAESSRDLTGGESG